VLALVGCVGFVCAIGIHFIVGYIDALHMAPACGGAVLYAIGLTLTRNAATSSANSKSLEPAGV
jgi:hypothetical protein